MCNGIFLTTTNHIKSSQTARDKKILRKLDNRNVFHVTNK